MTAAKTYELAADCGIDAESQTLSDGSKVWNVTTKQGEINCPNEEHAWALVYEIAEAIRRHTTL